MVKRTEKKRRMSLEERAAADERDNQRRERQAEEDDLKERANRMAEAAEAAERLERLKREAGINGAKAKAAFDPQPTKVDVLLHIMQDIREVGATLTVAGNDLIIAWRGIHFVVLAGDFQKVVGALKIITDFDKELQGAKR